MSRTSSPTTVMSLSLDCDFGEQNNIIYNFFEYWIEYVGRIRSSGYITRHILH